MGTTKAKQCECGAVVTGDMTRHKLTARHTEAQRDRDQLELAVRDYRDRQQPADLRRGYFDGGNRCYRFDDDLACCRSIRRPTLQHYRSAEHVAELHGVSVTELRRALRAVASAKRLELVRVA